MKKTKKMLFQTSISDVQKAQINPNFSTCKVRVLYTGKNRNMTTLSREVVENALPSLLNIPIVGEFSTDNKDFKGHGGAIDMDSYKFIHTTKPYGTVPESATYEWEEVKGSDGATREYLTINGCLLWTGRYEEAYSIIEQGKGQSMEIEITDGTWDDAEDSYRINNFNFSALCVLGDDVNPAFEDSSITRAYSLDKDSFKAEFSAMLKELKSSEKEDNNMEKIKELLAKYSVTMEDLTAKGIKFEDIAEDELESKIVEAMGITVEPEAGAEPETGAVEPETNVANVEPEGATSSEDNEPTNAVEPDLLANAQTDETPSAEPEAGNTVDVTVLENRIVELEGQLAEFEVLKKFKADTEKADHTAKSEKLFADFQLTADDVENLDIHAFSLVEVEEKCYAILGRKMAVKKNFSKQTKESNIRLPLLSNDGNLENTKQPYGGLHEKYKK